MAAIVINGRTWTQCQSEAEFRLKECMEFSGVFLMHTVNTEHQAPYKKLSAEKIEAYAKCAEIAKQIPGATEVVITRHTIQNFTCSFYTIDPENGNITRVFWFTRSHRYYADI